MDDLRVPFAERLSARQWVLADVVVAVLTWLAVGAAIKVNGPGVPAGLGWAIARGLAVLAACASFPFRRRFPVAVLGVTGGSVALFSALAGQHDGVSDVLTILLVALAVYTMVAACTRRAALAAAGAAVAAIEAGALAAAGGPDWVIAVLAPALAAVGWLAADNVRARRAYVQGVVERAAEREREQARRASAGERVRIARELHDVVAHAMSIIAVRSGVARMVLDVRPEEAREALGIIEGTSRQALAEMRLLVGVLRDADTGGLPADRGPAPGLASLPGLVSHINQAGVPVGVRVEGEPRPLPPGVDLSAYRIVQEALTNVVRHAAPAAAELTLRYRPCEVVIEVTDNGRTPLKTLPSAPTEDGPGHGIAGMRERVAVYGGKLVAEPTPLGVPCPRPHPHRTGRPVTISVVIADDQALVRGGFRVLVDTAAGMAVLGEAKDGTEAVALAREHHPDVVLMDVRMPVQDGIEATRQIKEDDDTASVKVLILTTFDLDEYVYAALRAGASGFLLKDTTPEKLLDAIRVVASGEALLAPTVTRRLIEAFTARAEPAFIAPAVLETLTGREREVLREVSRGLSNTEIAERLHMSGATAKTHVSRLLTKLAARDRAQLVVVAYESGLAHAPAVADQNPSRRPGRP